MGTELLSRRPALSFVAVTYLFSWGIWIPAAVTISEPGMLFGAFVVGAFGPAIAGAVMVVATGGRLRAWIRDMLRWRLPARWYLAALGLPLLFVVVETIVYAGIGGSLAPTTLPRRLAVWLGAFPIALLLTGGNEEPGWRGFLQPRLQRTYGALTAALAVGAVWTIWHVPMDVMMPPALDGGGYDASDALSRIATLPLAVVYAWLYNSTDGSVVVTMLFHAGWNTSQTLVPAGFSSELADTPLVTATRVAALLVLVAFLLVAYDRETLADGDAHRGSGVDGSGTESRA
ncbi:CPBP family intramembrane glutamic endopeptidase [Natronobacterium haloterrestre]|uniref:CPBP family intramembrane glutamic endopeptidase n=1 Tax=Natronobacterium haloterrestre TaxID=148448 RepID=UPI0015A707CD|nr:type II CAAX endopeptidase family protein [Halobiforma haloterrestris]